MASPGESSISSRYTVKDPALPFLERGRPHHGELSWDVAYLYNELKNVGLSQPIHRFTRNTSAMLMRQAHSVLGPHSCEAITLPDIPTEHLWSTAALVSASCFLPTVQQQHPSVKSLAVSWRQTFAERAVLAHSQGVIVEINIFDMKLHIEPAGVLRGWVQVVSRMNLAMRNVYSAEVSGNCSVTVCNALAFTSDHLRHPKATHATRLLLHTVLIALIRY